LARTGRIQFIDDHDNHCHHHNQTGYESFITHCRSYHGMFCVANLFMQAFWSTNCALMFINAPIANNGDRPAVWCTPCPPWHRSNRCVHKRTTEAREVVSSVINHLGDNTETKSSVFDSFKAIACATFYSI